MLKNYNEFTAAIEYTTGRFGFRDTLVEKDFLCSMVVMFLFQNSKLSICFKDGTLLAKIHAGFYRLRRK